MIHITSISIRHTISLLLLVVSSLYVNAQITTYKFEEKRVDPKRNSHTYDSLTNITRSNLPYLVGQKIQFLPEDCTYGPAIDFYIKKSAERGYGYDELLLKQKDCPWGIKESFNYEVFDIIGVDSIVSSRPYYFGLILKSPKYSRPIYYDLPLAYNKDYRLDYFGKGVYICGYLEKLKQINVGKKIGNKHTNNMSGSRPLVYDFNTHTPLKSIPQNYLWEIKDIAFVDHDRFKEVCYILSSPEHPKCYAKYEPEVFLSYAEYKNQREQQALLIKKFGKTNGNLIIQGKVKLGFTKAMCRAAWGDPIKINKSTGSWGTHEQWVYGSSSYLYFENGKLTAIDN